MTVVKSLWPFVVAPPVTGAQKLLTVNSERDERLSVGIFHKENGVERLVCVLVGNIWVKKGDNVFAWNKRNSQGELVPYANNCYAKFRSNLYTTEVIKVLGNTSTLLSGPRKWSNAHQDRGIVANATHFYPLPGYTEGRSDAYAKGLLSNPNIKIELHQQDSHSPTYGAIGGGNVLRGGAHLHFDDQTKILHIYSFVTACSESTDEDIVFSAGTPVGHYKVGDTYEFAVDKQYSGIAVTHIQLTENDIENGAGDNGRISGLAAQRNGAFGFVCRDLMNTVQAVAHTATGAVTVTWENTPGAREITLVDDNTAWVVIEGNTVTKYTVNAQGAGARTNTVASSNNSDEVVALGSLSDGTLAVVYGSNTGNPYQTGQHGIRYFNGQTGELIREEMNTEDYSAKPRILPKKRFFSNTKNFEKTVQTDAKAFFTGLFDGSYLVGDCGNFTVNRYKADGTIHPDWPIGFSRIGYNYSVGGDLANRRRIFTNYKEIDFDPATGKETDLFNWSAGQVPLYDDPINRLSNVRTFENGRRFCLLVRQQPRNNIRMVMAELDENNGLNILTDAEDFPATARFSTDGSITYYESVLPESGIVRAPGEVNAIMRKMRRPLMLPVVGIPQFGPAVVAAETPPVDVNDPVTLGGGPACNMQTANGTEIFVSLDTKKDVDPMTRGGGYHAGGTKKDVQGYTWRGMQTTHRSYEGFFPTNGWTDGGNGVIYAIDAAVCEGPHVLAQNHGEFSKGTQNNIWIMHYEDGLPELTFGPQGDGGNPLEKSAYMLTSNTVKISVYIDAPRNRLITAQNDEGFGGGVTIIAINGLDTVKSGTCELRDGFAPKIPGTPVFPELPFNQVLTNSSGYGVTYAPATAAVEIKTNVMRFGASRDITLKYRPQFVNGTTGMIWPAATLPASGNQESWMLWDKCVRFVLNAYDSGTDNFYIEVLDLQGRIICQISRREINADRCELVFNGNVVGSLNYKGWRDLYTSGAEMLIFGNSEGLKFKFGPFAMFSTNTPVHSDANMMHPALLQVRADTPQGKREYGISFTAYDDEDDSKSMRFYSNPSLVA